MQKIAGAIYPIHELIPQVCAFMESQFDFPLYSEIYLKKYIDVLLDDLWVYLEYPYVDKVYRSSYYSYFSTKHRPYCRNSIRISFFNQAITEEHFRQEGLFKDLQKAFMGFLTIRPTTPSMVGRTMLSPKAFKQKEFACCLVDTTAVINGVQLEISAFPYSAQDTETISCAETTVWATMEYFGNKYAEYSPVLSGKIVSTLSRLSYERQLPSHGLTAQQISYALKQYGFGTRLYARDNFGEDLKNIFFHYIESGIPFIATLANDKIGHAVVIIGQEKLENKHFADLPVSSILKLGNRKIINVSEIPRKYVVIDDNLPPYELANYDDPSEYYGENDDFKGCRISSIIVPLYPKIYLEAVEARKLVFSLLLRDIIQKYLPDETIVRLFLASNRSFKHKVALDSTIHSSLKERILQTLMPKFIWVAELSDRTLFFQGKAFGIIVVDATEANDNVSDALLFMAIKDQFIEFTRDIPQVQAIIFNPFMMYNKNLIGGF